MIWLINLRIFPVEKCPVNWHSRDQQKPVGSLRIEAPPANHNHPWGGFPPVPPLSPLWHVRKSANGMDNTPVNGNVKGGDLRGQGNKEQRGCSWQCKGHHWRCWYPFGNLAGYWWSRILIGRWFRRCWLNPGISGGGSVQVLIREGETPRTTGKFYQDAIWQIWKGRFSLNYNDWVSTLEQYLASESIRYFKCNKNLSVEYWQRAQRR